MNNSTTRIFTDKYRATLNNHAVISSYINQVNNDVNNQAEILANKKYATSSLHYEYAATHPGRTNLKGLQAEIDAYHAIDPFAVNAWKDVQINNYVNSNAYKKRLFNEAKRVAMHNYGWTRADMISIEKNHPNDFQNMIANSTTEAQISLNAKIINGNELSKYFQRTWEKSPERIDYFMINPRKLSGKQLKTELNNLKQEKGGKLWSNYVDSFKGDLIKKRSSEIAPYVTGIFSQTAYVTDHTKMLVQSDLVKGLINDHKLIAPENILNIYNGLTAEDVAYAISKGKGIGISYLITGPSKFGVRETPRNNISGLENIINKGEAVFWDLETNGPKTEFGRNIGNEITEFSFSRLKGNINTGEFTDTIDNNNTYNSIIGSTPEQHARQLEMIKKFEKGARLTEEEKVTLNRLALAGNTGMENVVENNTRFKGVYRFKRFKEINDTALSAENMRKGAELYFNIGNMQRNAGKVDFMGQQMYGWEAELLSGIKAITDNDLTSVGYNQTVFDIPVLDKFANSDFTSTGFKNALKVTMGGKNEIDFKHNVDLLMGSREFIDDRIQFFKNVISNIATPKQINKYGSKEEILKAFQKSLRDSKNTDFRQESLVSLLEIATGEKVSSAAHVAREDAQALASIVYKMNITGEWKKSPLYSSAKNYTATNDSKSAFFAINGGKASEYNLTVLSYDQLKQAYRTSEGVSIGSDNVQKEIFGQYGIRKNGLYEMTGLGTIDKDSKFAKIQTKLHKDMTGLSYVTLTPHVKGDNKSIVAASPITLIGSTRDIQAYMSSMTRNVGTFNADGTLDMSTVGEDVKNDIRYVSQQGNGYVLKKATADDLLNASDFMFRNNSAMRVLRNHDYKKDTGGLAYVDAMDKFAHSKAMEEVGTSDNDLYYNALKKYQQQFRDTVFKRSQELEEFYGQNPDAIASDEQLANTYHKFFGFENSKTGRAEVYSETASNITLLEDYYRRNKELIQITADASEKAVGGKDVDLNNIRAQYKARMNAVDSYVRNIVNSDLDYETRRGAQAVPRRAGDILNHFEVDLTDFGHGINPDDPIFSFSTSASGAGIADALFTKLGATDISNLDPRYKVRMLKNLQEHMYKNNIIDRFDAETNTHLELNGMDIDIDTDSVDIAGQKILAGVRSRRETDQFAGVLTDKRLGSIDFFRDNLGLSKEEIVDINNNINMKFVAITGKNQAKETEAATKEIMDNIVFDLGMNLEDEGKESFIEALRQKGITGKTAETQWNNIRMQYNDANEMVHNFVSAVLDNGGNIAYDTKTKMIGVSFGDMGAVERIYLPTFGLENGSLNVRLNKSGTLRINPIGIRDISRFKGTKRGDDLLAKYTKKEIAGNPELLAKYQEAVTGELALTTIIGQFNQQGHDRKWMSGVIKRNAEDGSAMEGIRHIIKTINRPFNTYETEINKDAAELRAAFSFDINDVVKNISLLKDDEVLSKIGIEGTPTESDKLFHELLTGVDSEGEKLIFNSSFKETPWHYQRAIIEHGDELLDALERYLRNKQDKGISAFVGESSLKELISFANKHLKSGLTTSGKESTSFSMEAFQQNKTLAYEKASHAAKYSKERANKVFEAYRNLYGAADDIQKDVQWGASIITEFEGASSTDANIDNLGSSTVDTVLRAKRLSIEEEDLHKIINTSEYLKNIDKQNITEEEAQVARDMIASISTNEAAGAMNPILADAAFSQRFYDQDVDVNNLDFSDSTIMSQLRKKNRHIAPKVEFERDTEGRITSLKFEYTNGAYLAKDNVAWKKDGGILEHSIADVAKENGFLQFRIFDGKKAISQEEVQNIINGDQTILNTIINRTKNENMDIVAATIATLREVNGYKAKLHIEGSDVSANVKLMDQLEKTMGNNLAVGLNLTGNQKIDTTLKKLGMESFKGRLLTFDVIKSIENLESEEGTFFEEITNSVKGNKKRTGKQIANIIKQQYASTQEFAEDILKERYSVWRHLTRGVLADAGILGPNDLNIGAIVNNTPGLKKHKDATVVNSLADNLYGLYGANAQDKVLDILSKEYEIDVDYKSGTKKIKASLMKGLELNKDKSRIITKEKQEINLDVLDKIVEEHFGTSEFKKENGHYKLITDASKDALLRESNVKSDVTGQNIIAEVTQTSFRSINNYDKAHSGATKELGGTGLKTIAVDQRMLENYTITRWSEGLKENAHERLKKSLDREITDSNGIKRIDSTLSDVIYNKYLAYGIEGQQITPSFIQDVLERSFYTPGGKDVSDVNSTEFKEMTKHLSELGFSDAEEKAKAAIRGMKKNSDASIKISADKVRDQLVAVDYDRAMAFNSGRKTKEDMIKNGFEIKKLSEIDVGLDSVESADSILNKNVLIDLKDAQLEEKLGGKLYSDEAHRYLALPITPTEILNKDGGLLLEGPQKTVRKLAKQYSLAMNSEVDKDNRDNFLQYMKNIVQNEIPKEISNQFGKNGVLKNISKANFADAVSVTAQAHSFYKSDVNNKNFDTFWNKLSFRLLDGDGEINLAEQAAKGKEGMSMGYAVLGNDVRDAWYNDKYFKSILGDAYNEDLFKDLKESTFTELKEHGTISTDVKYPTIYSNSMSQIMTAFSDQANGDRAFLSQREWLAKKGDWDSDKANFFLNRQKATISITDAEGNTKTHSAMIDYGTYNAIKQMKNNKYTIDVKMQDGGKAFRENISSIIASATDINPFVDPRLGDFFMTALSSDYMKNETYDGSSLINFNKTYTASEAATHRANYAALEKEKAYTDWVTNLENEAVSKEIAKHNWNAEQAAEWKSRQYNGMSDFLAGFRQDNSSLYKKKLRSVAVEKLENETGKEIWDLAGNKYLQSMYHHSVEGAQTAILSASLGNTAAGMLDIELKKMFSIAQDSNLFSADELRMFQKIRIASNESALTAKSESATDSSIRNLLELQDLNAKILETMRTGYDVEEVAQAAEQKTRAILYERKNKELLELPGRLTKSVDDLGQTNTFETMAKLQGELVRRVAANRNLKDVDDALFRQGITNTFYKDSALQYIPALQSTSLGHNALSVMKHIEENTGDKRTSIKVGSSLVRNALQSNSSESVKKALETGDAVSGAEAAMARVAARQAKNAAQQTANAIGKHGGIAGGLIGIAGGLLTSGFASGPMRRDNAPEPAQQQADNQSQNESYYQAQQVPQLSDSNMNSRRGGPSSGYVININASSPSGRDYAADAIQSAASALRPTNSSVNVQINNSFSNQMSQLQLNRMVGNALGIL